MLWNFSPAKSDAFGRIQSRDLGVTFQAIPLRYRNIAHLNLLLTDR
jgi:hypothetical protein